MKHLSQIITALVTALLSILCTICVQWWFAKGITPAQASAVGYLIGLGSAGLIGFAIHCFSLERLKEDNQEKQRQWERDRAEPTAAQKAEAAARYEQRLEEAMASHNLTLSFGHPVDQNGNRICEHCLLKYAEAHILETRHGLKDYLACPKCGKNH